MRKNAQRKISTQGYKTISVGIKDEISGSIEVRAILSHTDDLLKELRNSVNTNYEKEKENYKKQKKLVTV